MFNLSRETTRALNGSHRAMHSLLWAMLLIATGAIGSKEVAGAGWVIRHTDGTRYLPDGNGNIPVADPSEYPRNSDLDVDDPYRLFYSWRPNLFGIAVAPEWDFSNLINTDRPDFTDAPYTVGKGVTVLESGYTFRRSVQEDIRVSRRQLPEVLVRAGVTDELELRIKWNGYIMTDQKDFLTGLSTNSFGGDDLQLGFKWEVFQQEEWSPMVTFLGGSVVPAGTRGISANQMQPFANVVFGWGIRRWLYLKTSTGVDFLKSNDTTRILSGSLAEGPFAVTAPDNVTEWHQSVSLLYQILPKLGGFAEWFAFFSDNAADNRPSHFFDTGLYYYITTNVQLDIRYGTRLGDRIETQFAGAGFSTRW